MFIAEVAASGERYQLVPAKKNTFKLNNDKDIFRTQPNIHDGLFREESWWLKWQETIHYFRITAPS